MLLVDPAKIQLTSDAWTVFVVGFQHGHEIDAAGCKALCEESAIAEATSFSQGPNGTVKATINLRRERRMPEAGVYELVVSAPDPRDGGATALASVEVTLGDDRTCLRVVGAAPALKLHPPNKATVGIKLFNQCGHSLTVDVELTWNGRCLVAERKITIGAGKTVDVGLTVDADEAWRNLREGKAPDDLQVTVSRSGKVGAIETTAEVTTVVDLSQPAPPDNRNTADDDAKTQGGKSGSRPAGNDRQRHGGGLLRAVVKFGFGSLIALIGLIALIAIVRELSTPDEVVTDDESATDSPSDSSEEDSETTTSSNEEEVAAPAAERVTVGDYIGSDETAAVDLATNDGLSPQVRQLAVEEPDQDGRVISQDLSAGSRVDSGSTIGFVVGQLVEPPAGPTVGDYVGSDEADAVTAATDDGLRPQVNQVTVDDPDQDGQVIEQDLEPGEQVSEGAAILLTVGDLEGLVIPDVVGQDAQAAIAALTDAQREIGDPNPVYSDDLVCEDGGGGIVTAQQPSAGVVVIESFEVSITVAVTCANVPALVDLSLPDAAEAVENWQGEGRQFILSDSCPDLTNNNYVVTDVSPEAGTFAPQFKISCAIRPR